MAKGATVVALILSAAACSAERRLQDGAPVHATALGGAGVNPNPTCTDNADPVRHPPVVCSGSYYHLNQLKPDAASIESRSVECCCECVPTRGESMNASCVSTEDLSPTADNSCTEIMRHPERTMPHGLQVRFHSYVAAHFCSRFCTRFAHVLLTFSRRVIPSSSSPIEPMPRSQRKSSVRDTCATEAHAATGSTDSGKDLSHPAIQTRQSTPVLGQPSAGMYSHKKISWVNLCNRSAPWSRYQCTYVAFRVHTEEVRDGVARVFSSIFPVIFCGF